MNIKDVAKHAGVSTATISRVINNNGIVQNTTREKILRSMEALNYRPSVRQQLRAADVAPIKYKKIALLWTTGFTSETARVITIGLSQELKKIGAQLTVDYMTEPEDIPQCLVEGKLDGVIIHGNVPSLAQQKKLLNFPLTWILQAGSADFGDRVQPDHYYAGYLAADYFVKNDCKQVCCVSYDSKSSMPMYWQSRSDGFTNHMRANAIKCKLLTCPVQNSEADRISSTKKIVDDFLTLSQQPAALFIANDLGDLIHNELLCRGIVPMKDVLIVAGNTKAHPKVVDIEFYNKEIGQYAVESLIWRIKNPTMPLMTHSIRPHLVIPSV